MKPTKIATSCLAALVLCSAPWAAEESTTRIDPAGFVHALDTGDTSNLAYYATPTATIHELRRSNDA